ncbi:MULTISPECIES: ABC transporter ATP-binding protein [Bacillus]|uniref:ABC transporter ATP-binding protein n=1 Tax=Bacillus TaxID=1386 RepID=UPI001329CFA8|nr:MULTISPECIES: ABC transporter ATP-binding protein [unclassified Bacillus (in: firmicutes)]MDN4638061.1 ABC transporter ATP-binding protein [Bacillus sp. PsM16]MXP80898.1 ATP-binding cassette domain-containing protein [Bacillus sp. AN2]
MKVATEDIFFEVSNLTKKLGDTVVLDNLSFRIPQGSIVGFLGQNGAGKTTTLKVLANIIPKDSGILKFNGKAHTQKDKGEIMFLPDTPLVYSVLTGKEYLSFMSELLQHDASKYSYYTKKLCIEDALDKKISEYSLGMKKKISLIPLLLKRPKLLLLDEYFSGIDPISMRDIKIVLNEYIIGGNSVLLSTHQLDAAQSTCDFIIVIDKGKIHKPVISMEEILGNENSVEDYFINSITNIEES